MKTFLLLSIAMLSFSFASAQSVPNSTGVGLFVNTIGPDFGMGVHGQSPYFFQKRVAISARCSYQALEYYDNSEAALTSYLNGQVGLIFKTLEKEHFRMYNEFGFSIVSIPSFLSMSEEFEGSFTGVYGLFGFEYFYDPTSSCYLETGLHIMEARAESLPGKPLYAKGFAFAVGVRLFL